MKKLTLVMIMFIVGVMTFADIIIVKKGDTFYKLALKTGHTKEELLIMNDGRLGEGHVIFDSDSIYVGQKIIWISQSDMYLAQDYCIRMVQ
ncbi:LysM peptidoglycan-binding domain-containing protein [Candidatus Pacearchaeota archaeon]|nr:LysM peptidoglycan-binding domain-containing protein [Candidatus Pacearchaeota archaeon]